MQRYSKILFYINKNTSICIFIIYLFIECDPASPPMSVECLCRSHPLLKVRVCKYRTNGSLIRVISCHEPSLLMFIQYFSILFRTFSFPADCVRGKRRHILSVKNRKSPLHVAPADHCQTHPSRTFIPAIPLLFFNLTYYIV